MQGLNLFKPERIPRIDFGEFDLSDRPNCENQLKKYRYKCETNYRKAVVIKCMKDQNLLNERFFVGYGEQRPVSSKQL